MFQLITAIENRLLITFKYKNDIIRKTDVYILGVNNNGELMIRAFEINVGWKLFKVADMTNIRLTSIKVSGHKLNYNPADKAFKKIVKKVK